MVPFGSIVMAHIPLKDQTVLGGRCIRTSYVGIAHNHKGGILLYCPKTKRTIVRRSFRIMGPSDQPDSNILLESLEFKDPTINNDDIDVVLNELDLQGADVHRFGNDFILDFDDEDVDRIIHQPKISKRRLEDDEFYVEKIINHKGRPDRPSTMKFWVKWFGYNDTHNE